MGLAPLARASLARLAEALVALNRTDEARPLAEAVWATWQAEPPLVEELDEIREGYLALARTFTRLGELQAARACLELAYTFVQERAARLTSAANRQRWLNITVNRRIAAEWVEIEGSPAGTPAR